MADVKRTCGTWNGNINYHVALLQQILTQPVALAAHDESHVFGKLGVIDASGIVGSLNGHNLLSWRNNFMQIVFLAEIPLNIVAAGGGSPTHLAEAMLVFLT